MSDELTLESSVRAVKPLLLRTNSWQAVRTGMLQTLAADSGSSFALCGIQEKIL